MLINIADRLVCNLGDVDSINLAYPDDRFVVTGRLFKEYVPKGGTCVRISLRKCSEALNFYDDDAEAIRHWMTAAAANELFGVPRKPRITPCQSQS